MYIRFAATLAALCVFTSTALAGGVGGSGMMGPSCGAPDNVVGTYYSSGYSKPGAAEMTEVFDRSTDEAGQPLPYVASGRITLKHRLGMVSWKVTDPNLVLDCGTAVVQKRDGSTYIQQLKLNRSRGRFIPKPGESIIRLDLGGQSTNVAPFNPATF